MSSIPATTSSEGAPISSFEAYVVPHLVEVRARTSGIVRSVLVSPHGLVRRGEIVALLEPRPARKGEHDPAVAVTAPVAGLVTRCWAASGGLLGDDRLILTIASSENVLVLARFAVGSTVRIRRYGGAAVRFGGGEGEAVPATIISAIETPDTNAVTGRIIRVVLSVRDAPAKALWPGTPARVTVGP